MHPNTRALLDGIAYGTTAAAAIWLIDIAARLLQ